MANEEMSANDPLGNTIYFLEGDCIIQPEAKADAQSENILDVIRKPAILIEIKEEDNQCRFYFRSIDWTNTLLLEVKLKAERWQVSTCRMNPSNEELSRLLKKGKQIL